MVDKKDSNIVMDLEDRDSNIDISRKEELYIFFSKYILIVLNLICLMFFLSVIFLSLFIIIIIFLHVSYFLDFDPFHYFSHYFGHIYHYYYIMDLSIDNTTDFLSILVSYLLLIFILGDITRYVLTDQISSIYKTLDSLINGTKYSNDKKIPIDNIFLIILSAILFELFLKLFTGHGDYINLAYLIAGTLFSGAILLYILKKY